MKVILVTYEGDPVTVEPQDEWTNAVKISFGYGATVVNADLLIQAVMLCRSEKS